MNNWKWTFQGSCKNQFCT